ncbi:hypothetical protein CYME_CMR017C [Cyanidioschyzon merolae strain 10D]|uniref:Uncharacterized protein n=1 Tax=Cyanidioschyzon merolae (strain NIES-3377 / 10D) TaxID=280699 RepID=M1UW42_CYAM1|nr:hypothetical protein CYME_CMR017C [Cyanidioschyzon merolae strain 10D]BAM82306.1 hypothetical protein CYME_CMR017C [Cyanidioschyzon merolae strain 10D]|eukprot:XP_005538342.1 hypothetical protein CYME_CMR017C [Cyanidioschyzon merolae strain 10D]
MLRYSFINAVWPSKSCGRVHVERHRKQKTQSVQTAQRWKLRANLNRRGPDSATWDRQGGGQAERLLMEQVLQLRRELDALRAENESLRKYRVNEHLLVDADDSVTTEDGRTRCGKHGERSRYLPVYSVAPEEVLSRVIPVIGPNPTIEQLDAAITLSFQVRDELVNRRGLERYEDVMAGRFLVFQTSELPVKGVQRVALPGTVGSMRWASAPVGILMPASELGLESFYPNAPTDVNCLVIIEADFDSEIPADTLASPDIIRDIRDGTKDVLDRIENVWFDEQGRASRDAGFPSSLTEETETDEDEQPDENGDGPEFSPGKFYLWLEERPPQGVESGEEPAHRWHVRWYERRPDPAVDGVECVGRVITVIAPSASRRRTKTFAEEDDVF